MVVLNSDPSRTCSVRLMLKAAEQTSVEVRRRASSRGTSLEFIQFQREVHVTHYSHILSNVFTMTQAEIRIASKHTHAKVRSTMSIVLGGF